METVSNGGLVELKGGVKRRREKGALIPTPISVEYPHESLIITFR